MKRYLLSIFTLFISVVYLLSTMGYGVHECVEDGSKGVVILYGETPCEYLHSHVDENGETYSHIHSYTCSSCIDCSSVNYFSESSNCCNTLIYTVTPYQLLEDDISIETLPLNILTLYPNNIISDEAKVNLPSVDYNLFRQRTLPLKSVCDIYLINNTFLV